jgi:hypothetical protein
LTQVIDAVFDSVKYWQEKKLLLAAIPHDYFSHKHIMIRLLGVTSQSISSHNEAKKDMWNHHIQNGLGEDILQRIDKKLFSDFEFAKNAILKYNKTYVYLDSSLKASRELALLAATQEENIDNPTKFKAPILEHMPPKFQIDHEIALMATTRNIENLRFATNLRRNKYFIIDIMNYTFDHDMKQKILRYIDRDLMHDKRFVSRLGCFDNLCKEFHGDMEYVTNAVMYDMDILKKTDMFDEKIIKAALKSTKYKETPDIALRDIFHYIERFNEDYEELDSNIKDKKVLHRLFWEFGQVLSDEFMI